MFINRQWCLIRLSNKQWTEVIPFIRYSVLVNLGLLFIVYLSVNYPLPVIFCKLFITLHAAENFDEAHCRVAIHATECRDQLWAQCRLQPVPQRLQVINTVLSNNGFFIFIIFTNIIKNIKLNYRNNE